jgi:hypothetical protein
MKSGLFDGSRRQYFFPRMSIMRIPGLQKRDLRHRLCEKKRCLSYSVWKDVSIFHVMED